jgi:hypothetical protein
VQRREKRAEEEKGDKYKFFRKMIVDYRYGISRIAGIE